MILTDSMWKGMSEKNFDFADEFKTDLSQLSTLPRD
tara:strand:+ start:476 stop:583 length:108 start_codon:yes stop_codon:yes gene_type:complete